jgi:hypothetical protein
MARIGAIARSMPRTRGLPLQFDRVTEQPNPGGNEI